MKMCKTCLHFEFSFYEILGPQRPSPPAFKKHYNEQIQPILAQDGYYPQLAGSTPFPR